MGMKPSRFLDPTSPPSVLTLTLLAGLSALTMNIFLPSLPGMAAWFEAPYALMQLSVSLYLGLSAVLQIVIGPVSDRYGRRPVVLGALILFLLATAGTLLATSAEVFLVFRMAQAVIAAGMVLSRAIVRDVVPDANAAASMIGYVTMGMTLVPMIGPVIGGFLDEAFGWQANFSFLFLVGLGVLVLVWRDLGETAQRTDASLGATLRNYPQLLASRRFWGWSLTAALASGAFFAYLGGAPFVGTVVYGLSSSRIGMLFGLTALGYAAGNFIAGRYSVRLGMMRMAMIGTLATTFGLALLLGLTLAGLSGPVVFFAFTVFMGLGNGICLPNANAGILSARPELAGSASGLGGAITVGGGAALSALAARILGPGSTEVPLILLMLATSAASVFTVLLVMRRAKSLGLAG